MGKRKKKKRENLSQSGSASLAQQTPVRYSGKGACLFTHVYGAFVSPEFN